MTPTPPIKKPKQCFAPNASLIVECFLLQRFVVTEANFLSSLGGQHWMHSLALPLPPPPLPPVFVWYTHSSGTGWICSRQIRLSFFLSASLTPSPPSVVFPPPWIAREGHRLFAHRRVSVCTSLHCVSVAISLLPNHVCRAVCFVHMCQGEVFLCVIFRGQMELSA